MSFIWITEPQQKLKTSTDRTDLKVDLDVGG